MMQLLNKNRTESSKLPSVRFFLFAAALLLALSPFGMNSKAWLRFSYRATLAVKLSISRRQPNFS